MPEIKWIKISTGIFDDEKIQLIEAMPDADTLLVIWFKLLVLAGKINAAGNVHLSEGMAYTDEMLSTVFRRPLNSIRLALQVFVKFKMVETLPERLYIRNWEKYQNIETMERIRQLTKERVRKYRERNQPLLPLVTPCNVTVTQTEREREREREQEEDVVVSSSDFLKEKTVFNCFETYEKEIGLLTPLIKEEIEKYVKSFPADWIIDALCIASSANHRSWNYAAGILKNWAVKGRDAADNGNKPVDFKATGDRARHNGTYETDGIARTAEDLQKVRDERNRRLNLKEDSNV